MLTVLRRYALPGAVLLLLAASPASADEKISVMTQNQYLGADLRPLFGAPDAMAFSEAVVVALLQVAANEFPRRAERLAHLIAERQPHLVGLQEVWSFQCIDLGPPMPGAGCDDATIAGAFNDHLGETLLALAAEGVPYRAVARVENLDLRDVVLTHFPPGIPFVINEVPALLLAVDQDVILARADVAARPVPFPCARHSVNGCNFQAIVEAPTPAGPIPFERGFVAADATIGGRNYRFVNTHLETREPDPTDPLSPFFQAAQVAELIQTLAATTPANRTLIVVGDINSSPDDPGVPGPLPLPPPFDAGIETPYRQFTGDNGGYADIWTLDPESGVGFTCCQDEDLSNPASLLYERIDMIFARDMPFEVEDAEVVGDRAPDKTQPPGPGLWPSDHGSVAAEIEF